MKVEVYTDIAYSPRTAEALIEALQKVPPHAFVSATSPGVLRFHWEEER